MAKTSRQSLALALPLFLGLNMAGCAEDGGGDGGNDTGEHDDHGHDHDHETEQITRVTLTFVDDATGDEVTASFTDPDGDGGVSGSSEPITLAAETTYRLTIAFVNGLEEPEEDITAEISDEAEDHLVLLYGDAVAGPATGASEGALVHMYADVESDYGANEGDDLPVGLTNTITTGAAGDSGVLSVMLRHLPPVNDEPVKVAGLPESFAGGDALPGDVDADVDFDVTVQ